ncbi:hypothetical protein D5086_033126 [Populus alba]|uniref:Uncharacterized protein n=1 Tax=Populus alba TaxID=43335 RepID=A0ACC4AG29_POPAL
MCPLRFILVFFSAVLAGYFAWRTVRSSPEIDDMVSDDSTAEKTSLEDKQEFNLKRVLNVSCYWIFFSDDSKWILGIRRHGQWELLVEEFEGDEERCDLEKLVSCRMSIENPSINGH